MHRWKLARINPAVALGVRGTENVVNGVLCYAPASAVVEGGTYRATAYNGAYGVSATVNKLSKKTFSSYPKLIARNVRFVAKAKTTARGMSLTALAEAYGCSLYTDADSIYAYGAYLSSGSFTADSLQIEAQADRYPAAIWDINTGAYIKNSKTLSVARYKTAYGFYVSADVNDSVRLPVTTLISEANEVRVLVNNSMAAYGYYLTGTKKTIGDKTYVAASSSSIIGGSVYVDAFDRSPIVCMWLHLLRVRIRWLYRDAISMAVSIVF